MKKIFMLSFMLVSLVVTAVAQKPAIFSTEAGAVGGYDVVAYFKNAAAVKGTDSLSFAWKDANWKFSTRENLDAFKAAPMKFAPQYGGYCAFGLSNNYKAPTSPDAWTIIDDKLYLNYNNDVKSKWQKETTTRIPQADSNWVKMK